MALPSIRSAFQLRFSLRSTAFRYHSPLKNTFGCQASHFSAIPSPGLTCTAESGGKYTIVRPLGTQLPGSLTNRWVVVKDSNKEIEDVAKGPSLTPKGTKDDATSSFKREVEMQKLFKYEPMIRPMVDFVPSSETGGPLMILEPFGQTLWEARNTRPFSLQEIKWVMKGVLLGLYTVHMKGLVYTGKETCTIPFTKSCC